MKERPSVILVGETFPASRTTQRANALQAMGCTVDSVGTTPPDTDYETRPNLIARLRYRLRIPGDPAAANARLLDRVTSDTDVIWLEAARMIEAKTLWRAKEINPERFARAASIYDQKTIKKIELRFINENYSTKTTNNYLCGLAHRIRQCTSS